MGTRLVQGLIEEGRKVRVLDRPGARIDGIDVDLRHGDVSDPETLRGVFDGVDTVYHLAAILIAHDDAAFQRVNVNGTKNMVEASVAAGVKHFIFVSSASVTYPHTTAYSLSKREGERIVKSQDGMNYTIIRPTLAYNERGGEEMQMFLNYLKKYPVVPFIGTGRALKRPVHVDDLMAGFLSLANQPQTYGKTYAFSGGDSIAIWDMGKLLLKHHGLNKPFVPLPVGLCKAMAAVLARVQKRPALTWNVIAGVTQDANLDPSEATRDIGYRPMPVREGFEKCWPLGARRSA